MFVIRDTFSLENKQGERTIWNRNWTVAVAQAALAGRSHVLSIIKTWGIDNMEQTLYCRDRGLGGQAAQIVFMFSLKYQHGEQIIWSKCCTVTSAQANMTRRTNILYLCEYIQGE